MPSRYYQYTSLRRLWGAKASVLIIQGSICVLPDSFLPTSSQELYSGGSDTNILAWAPPLSVTPPSSSRTSYPVRALYIA